MLKPVTVHCRVEASEQVWRLTLGVARAREVRERRERREKCMAPLCVGWVFLGEAG